MLKHCGSAHSYRSNYVEVKRYYKAYTDERNSMLSKCLQNLRQTEDSKFDRPVFGKSTDENGRGELENWSMPLDSPFSGFDIPMQ